MNPNEIELSIYDLERETQQFERSLRTWFVKDSPQNHINIQRVNIECERIKTKIEVILKMSSSSIRHKVKIESVVASARFYIQKFEQAKEKWILLDGDILYKLWQNLK